MSDLPVLPDVSRRRFAVSVLSGGAVLSMASPALALSPMPPAWRPLRWSAPEARLPLRIERVSVHGELVGLAARTRIEIEVFNPNARVLEAELQFPLREGQIVSGFALDIQGELRPAVPVEKALGQQVFEEVTRARVDPALLEATEGENYKLRIYPLPAQGSRRVVLQIDQSLQVSGAGSARRAEWLIPLAFGAPVGELELTFQLGETAASAVRLGRRQMDRALPTLTQHGGQAQLHGRERGLEAPDLLSISLPLADRPSVAVQAFGGRSHFYAELAAPVAAAARALPREVALLWDASGSMAQRDPQRVLSLLDAWFAKLRDLTVRLVVARDLAEPVRSFQVHGGRWAELRQALQSVAYDGASHLGALAVPAGVDMALLVSDGLANWGEAPVPQEAVPLYALSASVQTDAVRLRALAEASGGVWLDLLSVPATEALRALLTQAPRISAVSASGAGEFVVRPLGGGERWAVAGILSEARAQLRVEWTLPGGAQRRQIVPLQAEAPRDKSGLRADAPGGLAFAAQRWASMRVAQLEADWENQRGEIRRLGRAYSLVTRETSLIVLDAVADYARHEIEPPPSLRAEYERLLGQQQQRLALARQSHLDAMAARFAQRVAWWETAFPKDRPGRTKDRDALGHGAVQDADAANSAGPARAARAEHSASRELARRPMAAPASIPAPAAPAPLGAGAAAEAKVAQAGKPSGPQASIRLAPWSPDSAYARRLRESPPELIYRRYLDERPSHANSTAFFLDVADILFEQGQAALALRVLSNLAEMNLENRHILRVLAYRLVQAGQPLLAIAVLRKVERLSPNEPQSLRDLGLAHAQAGQWQAAADKLWGTVARPWDARFPDVNLTALAELNATLAQAEREGQVVQTRAMDRRLLRNLPLDLRIVLTWDADNTDIDLHVTDPAGETVFYGHPQSRQGGRISRDVTGGYGPEEFALREAMPGRYTVRAQFFGHRQQVVAPATTLMLRLSTGFGTAQQKDEQVTLRLRGQGEHVLVGEFEVAPREAAGSR